MGDGDEVVEALQKEAELLKSKLQIERSKVTDKSCEYPQCSVSSSLSYMYYSCFLHSIFILVCM